MKKNLIQRYVFSILLVISLIHFSCSIKPQEIEYGIDNCIFCDMTIIDNKHSAEVVTSKGKVFKFDAIECMIRYTLKNDNSDYAYQLIADFSNPGQLVDAPTSSYLISENIPSPMGSYLSGFSSNESAKTVQQLNSGTIYTWDQIIFYFKKS